MNAARITRADVEQAATEAGLDVMPAMGRMQSVAARAGDEALLDRLCDIKADILGLLVDLPFAATGSAA